MGTCFGIVPYIDGPNTGTIAGIVAAGGNVGAVLFLFVFKDHGDTIAFHFMAIFGFLSSCLTPFIVVKGYRGILFGKDRKRSPSTTQLMVPAAVNAV